MKRGRKREKDTATIQLNKPEYKRTEIEDLLHIKEVLEAYGYETEINY